VTAARELPFVTGGEMGRLVAEHDWAATAVGPLPTWPAPLRTAVGIMLESRHPMLIWWGPDFTVFYNDAFMALAGDKHPSALGARGDETFAEVWPTIGPMLRHVLERGEATWVDDQLLLMNRRGFPEETYWTYSYSPIRDDDGRVLGVFTATNDTTDRVVGERRLDTLRALGDVSAVRLTSADEVAGAALEALAGNPVDLPFAAVLLGGPSGAEAGELRLAASFGLSGDSPLAAVARDPRRSIRRALRTGEPVLTTGLRERFPGVFPVRADAPGELGPDTALVLPLAAAGGAAPPGVLVIGTSPYRPLDDDYRAFLDLVEGQVSAAISDAQAYAAERRRSEALAELDRAKTEFFTGVSHEFRTPLTLMLGPIGELRADPGSDDPRVRHALDTVHRNGLRLGRLVDSLLDFSRLQAGRVRADHRPVDLAVLTADLASAFHSAVLAAGLDYIVDCADIGEAVHVDPDMWEKVVLNLVGNALKFTLSGGIAVTQHREGGEVVLRVTDTGSGIPAEHVDAVFDRFHRVEGTRARSHEGSGIGLALVRELVQLHGGRVDVDSEPDVGSTFTVRLPLGDAHLPSAPERPLEPTGGSPARVEAFLGEAVSWLPTEAPPAPGGPDAHAAGSPDAAPRSAGRVLVADDNADMRAYLGRLLATEWDVETVGDGAAALAAARDRPPDLLISDVMMPVMDGLELAAALRADPLTAQVPVLLLSARAGEEASVEGLAAGADDYLVKPFSAAELSARVQAHVRLGRRRRAAADRTDDITADMAGTLAQHGPALGWVSDATGRVGHLSGTWLEFTGGPGGDQLGDGWRDRVHPDDLPGHLQRSATARAAGRGWESEYRLRGADGRYRRMLELAVPIGGGDLLDGNGERIAGWVGCCVDITERHLHAEGLRRSALEKLERSEAAFRLLAEHADDVIGRHDLDGTWRWVSPSLERVTGCRPEDMIGRSLLEVVHPEDRDAVAAAISELGDSTPAAELTLRLRHADGHHRWFELRVRHVRDARTGTVELHSSHRDVTERLLAEEESTRFRALAERSGDFVAIADADGTGIYVNPAGRRLVGMPLDRPAREMSLADVVAPAARARYTSEALAGSDSNGAWTGPMDFVDSAGTPIPVRQALVTHRDRRDRVAFYSTVAADLRERQRADDALFEERERYRTLVAQAPVGIWVADRSGTTTFVNEQVAGFAGTPAGELAGAAWVERIHPGDRADVAASWSAAVRDGVAWEGGYRLVSTDGAVRDVRSSARPLRGPDGAVTGFLGTTVDVTEERRAEQIRRDAAAEHAARRVSDAAAARLRAMVQGLAAIVWEADWDATSRALRFTFVSDRAEELLGYPARRWQDDPAFWPAIIHPEDRAEALAYTAGRTAAGLDHDLTYRAVAVDGRVVWLHQVVHVVDRPDGTPLRAQGLTVDVTEQKRAERSAELLAETGRLITDGGTADERLAALARLVAHDLGDAATVSMIGADGLAHRVAVAHDDPDVERALLRTAPSRLPPSLMTTFAPGRPVVVPMTDELNRTAARDESDANARAQLGVTSTLVVPLVIGGRVVGLLGFPNFGPPRHYDDTDLDLAAELGRRASLMLAADRQRIRERHMQQVSAGLASAGGVAEAARLLVTRLSDVLGAAAMSVYLVEPERGIRLVHAGGYAAETLETFAVIRFDDPVPIAQVVRTGEPVWIRNREEWEQQWPELLPHPEAGGRHAAATLPLTAAGRVVGTIGISFPTERDFPADERDFVLALVAQAAPAFERAVTADERRMIAETLQTSLLPPMLPELETLALASRYLPGAHGTQAGGDWYDVLPLDEGRVAIAVGDVVGQGASAAAIMGQLRSVLSGYLLEGHDPVQALERLDRFAGRVPGAAGSTVACLVLDPAAGELVWARAGHPPPLLTGPGGVRLLEDATGTVLAVRGRPPFTAGRATVAPGDSIVLYTDGLVERRDEIIDDGLDRLGASAARHHALAPAALTDALLADAIDGDRDAPADDVALIVARLVPPPLRLELSAEAPVLRTLRTEVLAWAGAAGLDEDEVYDLQLAVGEAAANSVEHAYRDRPVGTLQVELVREASGTISVKVRDEGDWRPAPADKGFRGRGLGLIRDVTSRMYLDHGPAGTEVRFTLPPTPAPTPGRAPQRGVTGDAGPAGRAVLRVTGAPDELCVTVLGDLDLAGVRAVRDELLATVAGTGTIAVDLRATSYLASAGVALLVEADRAARAAGTRLQLLVGAGGIVRRALVLSGVDTVLGVLDAPAAGMRSGH
jgi:anti-anti-sigma factor